MDNWVESTMFSKVSSNLWASELRTSLHFMRRQFDSNEMKWNACSSFPFPEMGENGKGPIPVYAFKQKTSFWKRKTTFFVCRNSYFFLIAFQIIGGRLRIRNTSFFWTTDIVTLISEDRTIFSSASEILCSDAESALSTLTLGFRGKEDVHF